MAIAAAMNNNNNSTQEDNKQQDEHEHDVVMPGFRFHPTEEELVEFYLRRKVEGKRFNVELITFLDLYRYDPWELPGKIILLYIIYICFWLLLNFTLAAIGEKEWYFYVPRDRKYRNGDRPNRVTTSGYWKATGADRMIRSENLRSIGLKKTLVFYSGKAPKGIRTSWIMNEYRLPHHETERLQKKAEISLCRVYKRAGVEDHPSIHTRASSSRSGGSQKQINEPPNHQSTSSSFQPNNYHDGKLIISKSSPTSTTTTTDISTSLALLSKHTPNYTCINPLVPLMTNSSTTISASNTTSLELEDGRMILHQSKQAPNYAIHDDLHKLVNNGNHYTANTTHDHVPNLLSHFSSTLQPVTSTMVPEQSIQPVVFSDRLWDWNAISEAAGKDYNNIFK
ncbi:hypothetical protein RD792_002050 [Penstemon davidsonii]|uniref:NAC domain-containing protein n=1 Tax=Penstemon davidsonii TaxID=160366 RepID=A0ABR0DPZ2_9LAMI|nr:hypothetical protein RD792_002050 [Penstemon davidsonii]